MGCRGFVRWGVVGRAGRGGLFVFPGSFTLNVCLFIVAPQGNSDSDTSTPMQPPDREQQVRTRHLAWSGSLTRAHTHRARSPARAA